MLFTDRAMTVAAQNGRLHTVQMIVQLCVRVRRGSQVTGMLRRCIEWLESGEKSPADIFSLCRTRIAEREPELRASGEGSPPEPPGCGPHRGSPFGVQDTYQTLGLCTRF